MPMLTEAHEERVRKQIKIIETRQIYLQIRLPLKYLKYLYLYYLQIIEDIFKYLKISLIDLKISSNDLSYLQLYEDIVKY